MVYFLPQSSQRPTQRTQKGYNQTLNFVDFVKILCVLRG